MSLNTQLTPLPNPSRDRKNKICPHRTYFRNPLRWWLLKESKDVGYLCKESQKAGLMCHRLYIIGHWAVTNEFIQDFKPGSHQTMWHPISILQLCGKFPIDDRDCNWPIANWAYERPVCWIRHLSSPWAVINDHLRICAAWAGHVFSPICPDWQRWSDELSSTQFKNVPNWQLEFDKLKCIIDCRAHWPTLFLGINRRGLHHKPNTENVTRTVFASFATIATHLLP